MRRRELVRLHVPGALHFRDLAVRVVAAACKLVTGETTGLRPRTRERGFDDQVVSAFGEAFNNVAIHGYRGRASGDVQVDLELATDAIVIRMMDFGASFDPTTVPAPNLDELPESGFGVYIIRSFMDEVSYVAGRPNVLTMTKRL